MSTNILGSLPIRFLLLFLLPLESVSVYVANNGTDNPNCLQGSPNYPCKNLTLALEYIHDKNDSIVYIENGVYDLLPSSLTIFQSVTNITIAGEGRADIACHNEVNAGLTFLRSSNVHIHGIRFSGCGVIHNSTSRDFNNKSALNLLPFNTTLYFEGCVNVTLDSVHVTESLGIAVQFYTTTGTNMIINSNFSNNPNRSRAGQVIGGGVYIEFPYCQPGDTSCNNDASSVDINTISNSQYIINDSVFSNNMADSSKKQAIRYILPYKTYHDAFGRGGGLSIFFKGNAANNAFSIANCIFENNRAVYGGGLYVEMQDNSYNNSVKLYNHNEFIDNSVNEAGGGMLVSYLFLQELNLGEINSSSVELEDVSFNGNTAGSGNGGGLSYSSTRQENLDGSFPNTLSLTNCEWISNTARAGSALDIRAFHPVTVGSFPAVSIINSSFYNNSVMYTSKLGKPLGTGAMYVDDIPIEFSGFVIFENNYNGTALAAFHASITFLANTITKFQKNKGHNGGAIALYASSFIKIWPYTKFLFAENSVTNLGGAIYVEYLGAEAQITAQNCFFRYHDYTIYPKEWKTHLEFSNNVAGNSKNSIYSTSVYPCLWGRAFGEISESHVDEVFCWNTEDEIHWDYGPNTTNETCKSQILTGVSEFSESSLPLYLNVTPGKLTPMDITGTDEQGKNVSLVVQAYSHSEGVKVDDDYKYVSSDNILLYKTNEFDGGNASIIINTIGQTTIQTELIVNFQDCPPGLFLNENEGKCVCYKDTFGGRLKCDQTHFTAELLRGFWIGTIKFNETVVAHCRNCDFNFSGGYLNLGNSSGDVEQSLCSDNSEGRLCSKCKDGYAPAINLDEFKCVECSHKHQSAGAALFFFVDICGPIVFLLFLYWIDVPLTNGLLHGPIFFAQMITTVISLDADGIIQYQDIPHIHRSVVEGFENTYTTIYDFFNLEFFMFTQNFCLPGVTKYVHIIALYYIPAFVPMILVFVLWLLYLIYNKFQNFIKAWCINVSGQFNKIPKCLKALFFNLPKNASNVLAMFIILSYTKIAVITGYLLTPVIFYKSNARSHEMAVYQDGSVDYLSSDHIKVFIPAIIITVFFLMPVPVILMIFRFNDPKKNDGFFNYLLYQFQRQFRNGPEDTQSKTKELHEKMLGKVKTCLDDCSVEREGECCSGCCCGNGIPYTCICCKSTQLFSFTQQKSQYFCCAIHTSCSPYDYRWLSGGFFVLPIILLISYVVAWNTIIRYILQFFICAVAAMLIIIFRPYKMDRYPYVDPNIVESVCLILLSILIAFNMYQYTYTAIDIPLSEWAYVFQLIIIYLPLLWIGLVFVILWVKQCYKRFKKLKESERFDGYISIEINSLNTDL